MEQHRLLGALGCHQTCGVGAEGVIRLGERPERWGPSPAALRQEGSLCWDKCSRVQALMPSRGSRGHAGKLWGGFCYPVTSTCLAHWAWGLGPGEEWPVLPGPDGRPPDPDPSQALKGPGQRKEEGGREERSGCPFPRLGAPRPRHFPCGGAHPSQWGLFSGKSGSPQGPWTLTATEATTSPFDFHVLDWGDPVATTGHGRPLLLHTGALQCPAPHRCPTDVCRAQEGSVCQAAPGGPRWPEASGSFCCTDIAGASHSVASCVWLSCLRSLLPG